MHVRSRNVAVRHITGSHVHVAERVARDAFNVCCMFYHVCMLPGNAFLASSLLNSMRVLGVRRIVQGRCGLVDLRIGGPRKIFELTKWLEVKEEMHAE